jgi:hypothetical protein
MTRAVDLEGYRWRIGPSSHARATRSNPAVDETVLFGETLPRDRGEHRPAQSNRDRVHGNVQPAAAVPIIEHEKRSSKYLHAALAAVPGARSAPDTGRPAGKGGGRLLAADLVVHGAHRRLGGRVDRHVRGVGAPARRHWILSVKARWQIAGRHPCGCRSPFIRRPVPIRCRWSAWRSNFETVRAGRASTITYPASSPRLREDSRNRSPHSHAASRESQRVRARAGWKGVARIATAILDRLLHHAVTLNTRGSTTTRRRPQTPQP